MNLKIEYVSKEALKPYINNAKIHTEEQVEQIKKSIEQFGMNDPIAVWHDNEIIEGHGRLLAVMGMDVQEVPIIRLDTLTDDQRKAYALVHNKLTMNTGFDINLIEEELSKISNIAMDYFGFRSLDDIEAQLEDFFTPDEEEQKATQDDTIVFVFNIKPTPENKESLLEFLKQGGYEYDEK